MATRETSVARPHRWSAEKRRRSFGSPLMVADSLKRQAARLNHCTLDKPAREYAPLLSPQKVSEARNHGGAVGDVAVQMLADPENAMRTAMHLLGVARSVVGDTRTDLLDVLCKEQRADSAEDIAQADVMADRSDENLRRYIEQADAALAALQEARDAAARELETRKGGE